ncbi:lipopolysaccharide biosynthesis protein [Botrimarina mediterranea]|uniref:Polysaccharide biosynthesis protein n=1 Tax=Botrimarina mediterranea TaxID=2528022 RepID=A0A518K3D0_9BACT|nr:hypothetical protein [Botrimarina mediterranea]QDV72318.1 hypothetical protein Spa11_04920 [Botrimarina mediterranea]QDV76862.1 hypothetical protein K2D_04450 [Planctomycetes bacterium K2D]
MNQANLLLLNTGATFARMAASVVLGLWTTRIAYQELGREGFGAYAAALAVVMLLPVLLEAFSSSAQRHIAYAIGAADADEVHKVSGTFVTLSLAAAAVFAAVIFTAAPLLSAPLQAAPPHADRLSAALVWIGVMTSFVIAQAPYRSYLIARQSIALLTGFEMLESIARFGAAAMLLWKVGPTIVDYARYTTIAVGIPTMFVLAWCTIRYSACRPTTPTRVGLIAAMGAWITLGLAGWKLRTQGVQVAINTLYGAAETASYNVGLQLALYQNNLSSAVYRAVRPATISAQGRGKTQHVRQLAISSSKLISIGTLIAAGPLLFETRTILTYWIGEAPDDMVTMARLLVGWIALKDLSIGHLTAIHADGRVARHEALVLGIDLVALTAGCAAAISGAPVWVLPMAAMLAVIGHGVMRVMLYSDVAALTPRDWASSVLAPWASVAAGVAIVSALLIGLLEPTVTRLVLVVAGTALVSAFMTYIVVFDAEERRRLWEAVQGARRRLSGIS